MAKMWKFIVFPALIFGAGTAAIAASSPAAQRIETATAIVPEFAATQLPSDRLPEATEKTFVPVGIDPASTRFLGHSQNFQYFAAPLSSDRICIVTVRSDGQPEMMGCTKILEFDGLRVSNSDKSEEGWLVVPNTTKTALSGEPAGVWSEQANNFLVKGSGSKS